jgi:hypothetical protein
MRRRTLPSARGRASQAALEAPGEPGRTRRPASLAIFHAGVVENVTDTVVFRERFSLPGGPLATGRYRR